MKTIHLTDSQLNQLVILAGIAVEDARSQLDYFLERRDELMATLSEEELQVVRNHRYREVEEAVELHKHLLLAQQDGE